MSLANLIASNEADKYVKVMEKYAFYVKLLTKIRMNLLAKIDYLTLYRLIKRFIDFAKERKITDHIKHMNSILSNILGNFKLRW